MLKEISVDAAKGRVLRDIVLQPYGSLALLVFDDGCFVTLGVKCDYVGDAAIVKADLGDPCDFGDDLLARAGIATVQELDDMRQAKRKRIAESYERQDRAAYERLRSKYGKQKRRAMPEQESNEQHGNRVPVS